MLARRINKSRICPQNNRRRSPSRLFFQHFHLLARKNLTYPHGNGVDHKTTSINFSISKMTQQKSISEPSAADCRTPDAASPAKPNPVRMPVRLTANPQEIHRQSNPKRFRTAPQPITRNNPMGTNLRPDSCPTAACAPAPVPTSTPDQHPTGRATTENAHPQNAASSKLPPAGPAAASGLFRCSVVIIAFISDVGMLA